MGVLRIVACMKSALHTVRTRLLLLGALCTLSTGVQAQTVGEADLLALTRRWLVQAVAGAQASGSVPLRIEINLGALDARLRLAPCAQPQPYTPPGSRLWGNTRVGLRCVDGLSKWNVFLSVTIRAWGPAWVMRKDVGPGAVLLESDVMQSQVDWAEDASPIMAEPSAWVGQVATRALSTGQALRQNLVRPAQVFQAGAQVRVLAQGSGFQISADGQALSPGVVGQQARVRMDNGRVMSGMVLDARTVQVDM